MKRVFMGTMLILAFVQSVPAHSQAQSAMPLRNPRETVIQLYSVINESGRGGAKEIYQTLSVDMRSDLWTLHLEQFLGANPALTSDQQAVTMEAIGLLTSGVLQLELSGGEGSDRAREQMNNIAKRAALVFSRQERAVFFDLSRYVPIEAALMTQEPRGDTVFQPQPLDLERLPRPPKVTLNADCECNTDPEHDFCGGGPTAPLEKCRRPPFSCTRTTCCCGWWWAQPCNGLCDIL